MFKNIALILLLLCSTSAAADSYWLLGSFPDRDSAVDEAKKISAECGIEVFLLSGSTRYRLMSALMSDENDRADLRRRLARIGIKNIFVMNYGDATPDMGSIMVEPVVVDDMMPDDDLLDAELTEEELAEIDAMLSDDNDMLDDEFFDASVNYVVAGSFREEAKAEFFSRTIDAGDYGISIRSAVVGGTEYHRILVGPVSEGDEVMVMRRLAEQGHNGVWVLRGVKSPRSSQSLEIGTPPRGFKVPSRGSNRQRRSVPLRQPGEDSDFNLAKLKKKLVTV